MYAVLVVNGAGDVAEWTRAATRAALAGLLAQLPAHGWRLHAVAWWSQSQGQWVPVVA